MTEIQWIFFDIGGVLADDTALERARDEVVLGAVKAFRAKPTANEFRDARMRASAKTGGLTENMIRELLPSGSAACADAIKEADVLWKRFPKRAELSTVRPDAAAVLRPLSKKYKLGLMVNQPSAWKEELLGSDVLSCFTHAGMSEKYGVHKPDRRLFEAVLAETGAKPARSAMVDDNFERGLQPARDLGLKTVLFKADSRPSVGAPKTDWTITELTGLVTIFG